MELIGQIARKTLSFLFLEILSIEIISVRLIFDNDIRYR